MSEDKAAAKPAGKISRFFSRIAAVPGRWSLAARAAILLGLALALLVGANWIYLLFTPGTVPLRHSLTSVNMLVMVLLLAVIPVVVYFALRLWLEGERSRFPEIDFAWKAGLEALERNGLSLDAIPIFLVLGSSGERLERALMEAGQLQLRVRGVPEGPAPLHWYANPDRIYLVCSEVGWLSALARLVEERAALAPVRAVSADTAVARGSASAPNMMAVQRQVAAPAPVAVPSDAVADETRGTLQLDSFVPAAGARPLGDSLPKSAGAVSDPTRGTLVLPMSGAESLPGGFLDPSAALPATVSELPAILAPQESAVQLQRLQYVCQLLRLAREPLCAANGVLALLPYDVIQAGHRATEELQRAVRQDLTTLQRTLRLRAPVTALVTGMEKERGFRELVRRVGRERAAGQRFGRRFDVRSIAGNEELAALSAHVCGAFEDWIYTLFREDGALTRPGNTLLYGLLCKVRCNLKERLTEVLADGFGHDAQLQPNDEPLLFSGCYFAATGESEDRRAFVKGVLDKLEAEQEEVEWTQRALRTERRDARLLYAVGLVDAALVASFAWLISRSLVE